MNPQDQNQPQIQQPQIPQQQPQNQQPVLSDAQVEDTFIKESAQAMLDDEAANPGSQDPDALEWARNVVNGLPTTSGDTEVEVPVAPIAEQQPGQTIQPTPTEQAASPDGHVLYIDRSQEQQQPSQDNNQPQVNGDNNGNSN